MAKCTVRVRDCRCHLEHPHPTQVHSCGVPGCLATWRGDPADYTFQPLNPPVWPVIPAAFGPARNGLRSVRSA
jgi:hypothetical protein